MPSVLHMNPPPLHAFRFNAVHLVDLREVLQFPHPLRFIHIPHAASLSVKSLSVCVCNNDENIVVTCLNPKPSFSKI